MPLTLPPKTFTVFIDLGPRYGIGSADFCETLDDAATLMANERDRVADFCDPQFRVEMTERNPDTKLPERVTDVTEEVEAILAARLAQRGWAA